MSYQVKSFLLKMLVIVGAIFGLAQLCAWVSGESSLLQTILFVVPCVTCTYFANCALEYVSRTQQRKQVKVRVAKIYRPHAA